jgi:predicted ArsR family transcriptional regulator
MGRPPPYPDPTMPTRGSRKAARLLNLAANLAAGPRTAADLARQLSVSHRTLQRDLDELPRPRRAVPGRAIGRLPST